MRKNSSSTSRRLTSDSPLTSPRSGGRTSPTPRCTNRAIRSKRPCPPSSNSCERVYGNPPPVYLPFATVENRLSEYEYSIDIPKEWNRIEENFYQGDFWGLLWIQADPVSEETALETFAESVRDNLERDWRERRGSMALFEITSFREGRAADGRPVYYIGYRAQSDPIYCVVDGVEMVALASHIPNNASGFRVTYELCIHDEPRFRGFRNETLDSFRILEE